MTNFRDFQRAEDARFKENNPALKVPCVCQKGGVVGEGELTCQKCDGYEWIFPEEIILELHSRDARLLAWVREIMFNIQMPEHEIKDDGIICKCWCNPKMAVVDGAMMFVHNDLIDREELKNALSPQPNEK